jgi:thymidine kinase
MSGKTLHCFSADEARFFSKRKINCLKSGRQTGLKLKALVSVFFR